MSIPLLLAWFGLAAQADDGGVHPAMKCQPDDQQCIERANREYEAQQKKKTQHAAKPKAKAQPPPAPPAEEAARVEEQEEEATARAAVVERRFYKDDGNYLSVVLVDGEVRTVEAHPIDVIDRAAVQVDPAAVGREEQAEILERSARAWQDLAVERLPPQLERQIDVEPVPAG